MHFSTNTRTHAQTHKHKHTYPSNFIRAITTIEDEPKWNKRSNSNQFRAHVLLVHIWFIRCCFFRRPFHCHYFNSFIETHQTMPYLVFALLCFALQQFHIHFVCSFVVVFFQVTWFVKIEPIIRSLLCHKIHVLLFFELLSIVMSLLRLDFMCNVVVAKAKKKYDTMQKVKQ